MRRAPKRRVVSTYAAPTAAFFALCAASLISAASRGAAHSRGLGVAGAPESALALRNPYEAQPDAAPAGRKLFGQYCAACHGREAQGRGVGPRLDGDEVAGAPDGKLFWFVTNGDLRRGMPAWSGLPAARRWQIVAYLKTLGSTSRR